jgi:hypothetical protein
MQINKKQYKRAGKTLIFGGLKNEKWRKPLRLFKGGVFE